ncbi:MAG TPA: SDR family oxidoreductase [Acidimicrobiia bacterium]|nr:SDR family oxidoreductase [Acidimicrobiia bacterium]
MDVSVKGKVALVTGGSRGIGQETALEMLRSGAEGVAITSRKQENIDQSKGEMVDAGADPDRVLALAARADDEEAAFSAVSATVDTFGACDILVNNAGTNPAFGNLMEVDLGALDKTWDVNMRAPLLWVRAAYRHWMSEHGGSIVNVASVAGLRPSPFMGAYNVSKAGLIHMTRQLALELAPGIRVNAVAPAVVRTRLAGALLTDESATAALHPLGRVGDPEDVAKVIVFLASDTADWMTGAIVPVDGGVVGAGSSGIS